MEIKDLVTQFEQLQNPERATAMSAYMKNQFEFHGIPSPVRKKIINPLFREAKIGKVPIEWQFVKELWGMDQREYQYAAIDYLIKSKKLLVPDDLSILKQFIMTKSWWDTVDLIASHLVGQIVITHPDYSVFMDKWIEDENMWVRRTAILHQLSYKENTNKERLFTYCEKHAEDKQFFIAKAIGWALREYAKSNPHDVLDFVHSTPLQNLSKREALKHLK